MAIDQRPRIPSSSWGAALMTTSSRSESVWVAPVAAAVEVLVDVDVVFLLKL